MVRSNCETIRGATTRRLGTDYSKGVAIGSSFYPARDTHIEAVRYPKGSNLIGPLATILVPSGRLPRVFRFLGQAVRDPITFLRASSVHHWSERTLVLLVMQSRDTSLGLVLKKRPWGLRLTTLRQGARLPSDIPAGNVAARYAAEAMDGFPGSTLNEVLGDIPLTAHILGGACVGTSPQTGVIDPYHRVFGHAGPHVADGSAISANLGANPALTITALAERAFAYWPNKGEPDPRPPLVEYEPVPPVAARHPAVPRSSAPPVGTGS